MDLGGKGTHTQVSEGMRAWGSWTSSNNANKLLGEMVKVGLVERLGTVTCPLSGFEATLWGITGRWASEAAPANGKGPSLKQLRVTLDSLTDRVCDLEGQVDALYSRGADGT